MKAQPPIRKQPPQSNHASTSSADSDRRDRIDRLGGPDRANNANGTLLAAHEVTIDQVGISSMNRP